MRSWLELQSQNQQNSSDYLLTEATSRDIEYMIGLETNQLDLSSNQASPEPATMAPVKSFHIGVFLPSPEVSGMGAQLL